MRLLDAFVPLMVAAVITLGGLLPGADGRPVSLLLGVAAAASLAWRRRAPGVTLAVSGALALVLVHLEPAATPAIVLAPAVALFSLARTRGRAQQALGALAAVAAIVLAEAVHPGHLTPLQTFGHALLVAIPLLLAETVRSRSAILRERVALAEQAERMRIARDLHDVVAHTLTAINVQASTAAELGPDRAHAALRSIEDASRDAIHELRAILGVLRDDAPLAPAPGVDTLGELVRRSGLDVSLEIAGEPPARLPDSVSLAAFRIVQESLTNARRHAPGAPVRVTLRFGSAQLGLCVENEGVAAGESTPGVGIRGMIERAAAVGGTLRAAPQPGGFRVDAELPYP